MNEQTIMMILMMGGSIPFVSAFFLFSSNSEKYEKIIEKIFFISSFVMVFALVITAIFSMMQ